MNPIDPSLSNIVAIITALGVIAALFYNGVTIRSNQQNRKYQAYMDLQKELDSINEVVPDIGDLMLKESELEARDKDVQNKVRLYRKRYIEFHNKVARLVLKHVLPDSIAKYFHDSFASAQSLRDVCDTQAPFPIHAKYLKEWCSRKEFRPKKIQ